jgi:tryptophan-rich sensory protein
MISFRKMADNMGNDRKGFSKGYRMARSSISFVFFIVAVAVAGLLGSLFSPGDWYAALRKPPWNPPDQVFGPVWTALYFMMALAAWQVSERQHRLSGRALRWWFIQLALNTAWSWLFFGLHRTGWALACLAALWVSIGITIRLFRRIRPLAGTLMLPYLAWVSFAFVLNFWIWWKNGGGLESIFN